MSTRPTQRPTITLTKLAEMKALGEPIAMITAYDFPSAQVAEEAGVDIVLVGDSGAMTVLGYPSTVPVTLDELLMLASAARRGLSTPLLVGDLPFGSYEVSNEQAIATAQRFLKEAGCDAVKLERGGTSVERARAIIGAGIPVMGHVGLTPQTATALGGYRSQGRTAERALQVMHDALGAPGGRLLRDRLRGDPGRAHRADHAAHADPRDRDRRRRGDRRPGAGLPRPARDLRRARRPLREALRGRARRDDQGREGVRRGGAHAPLPRARARLHDGAGRDRAPAGADGGGHRRAVHGRLHASRRSPSTNVAGAGRPAPNPPGESAG